VQRRADEKKASTVDQPRRGEVGRGRVRWSDTPPIKRGDRSADYLLARIKRDRPDILDRIIAGEFPSVREVAAVTLAL